MKKATKRIPILFEIVHPKKGVIVKKEVLTNDVDIYLKSMHKVSLSGNKWKMIPLKRFRVWLEDSVEPEGGFWWYCFQDAR